MVGFSELIVCSPYAPESTTTIALVLILVELTVLNLFNRIQILSVSNLAVSFGFTNRAMWSLRSALWVIDWAGSVVLLFKHTSIIAWVLAMSTICHLFCLWTIWKWLSNRLISLTLRLKDIFDVSVTLLACLYKRLSLLAWFMWSLIEATDLLWSTRLS